MPTVELAFSAAPQYVRTARLVGVAVARRAGVAEELLDEVRLAVGEVCGRAVARHQQYGVAELVRVELSDDGPYTVRVIDAGPPDAGAGNGADSGGEGEPDGEDDRADADRMQAALLAAIAGSRQVLQHPEGTEVRLVWPVRRAGWPVR